MKKKKIRFDEIKSKKYFKYYGRTYIKQLDCFGIDIRNATERYMFSDDNVIPVTVTIKVKEK